jgi:hypothetical protein
MGLFFVLFAMSQWIKGKPIDEALCIKINSTILKSLLCKYIVKQMFVSSNTRPFVLWRLKDVSFSFKEQKFVKGNRKSFKLL